MKKTLIITLLTLLPASHAVWATSLPADTSAVTAAVTADDDFLIPDGMLADIDSILRQWSAQKFLHFPDECTPADADPYTPDSVIAERLALLPTVIPMPYNSVVRKCIDAYTKQGRRQVSYLLASANFYIPIFEEALDAYGLPIELKYLPIVESSLNPTAVSRVGATGLWQFMITTAQQYGLTTNSLLDERRDPIKSSYAAARYLRDLYHIFGDWTLALAAYNCGPQNVNKAIHRAGGAKDYWQIYSYLPRETRGYVPAFIAANYVMNYYCEHGISPMEADLSFKSDTLMVGRRLHLEQIAGACGLDIEAVRALNPQYKADVIPDGNYSLRLPEEHIVRFLLLGDSVYNYMADTYANPSRLSTEASLQATTTATQKSTTTTTATKKKSSVRYHRIRRGETLSTIAKRYGVSVSQLKRWNGLRGTSIRAGRRLKIMK
ncbi:MAG: transglycosylase SLT domain-containing protein [Bacteroidaceae bacterium]|jgi:membrane-bound lytic murein transglycosylase D